MLLSQSEVVKRVGLGSDLASIGSLMLNKSVFPVCKMRLIAMLRNIRRANKPKILNHSTSVNVVHVHFSITKDSL